MAKQNLSPQSLLKVLERSTDTSARQIAAGHLASLAGRAEEDDLQLAARLEAAYSAEKDLETAALLLRALNALRLRARLGKAPGAGRKPRELDQEAWRHLLAELKHVHDQAEGRRPALEDVYEIMGLIAEGGMGRVFKARRKENGELVAIKLLDERFLSSHKVRQRFEREYRILKSLDHPNIVKVLDHGADEDRCFIVMEYLPGGDLEAFTRSQPVDVHQALHLLCGTALGLQAAHEQGIIHRDVKPSNVLLTYVTGELVPRLADFGLAKDIGRPGLTSDLTRMGTPEFCSPEQLASAKNVGPASDIYSLGVTCYFVLSGGRYPADDYLRLDQLNPEVPPAVHDTVERCLARRPEDRWPCAKDLAVALTSQIQDTAAVANQTEVLNEV
ncbi:MAG: serine/threonine-protein kinase [Thermodesulfobacteriota bacterium]